MTELNAIREQELLDVARENGGSSVKFFATHELMKLCRVSARQLQWWDEEGVVMPKQEGHKRLYSPEQVRRVYIVSELRRKGLSLQQIRKILVQLNGINGGGYLVTDGRKAWQLQTPLAVVEALRESKRGMYVVDCRPKLFEVAA